MPHKKLLKCVAVLSITLGIILIISGFWGAFFVYKSVVQENIVTSADASIPGKPVRGPFTLKAQADVIREHTLKTTGGKTYAQMPRQIKKLDENNQPVLDETGLPIMSENTSRSIWITATTLTTALYIGILSYAFCALVVVLGCFMTSIAIVFYRFDSNHK